MAVLKYITAEPGVQCAMISGISTTQMLFVVSQVSLEQRLLHTVQDRVEVLAIFGWMMSNVAEEKLHCSTVRMQDGVQEIVAMAITGMQVSFVRKKQEMLSHKNKLLFIRHVYAGLDHFFFYFCYQAFQQHVERYTRQLKEAIINTWKQVESFHLWVLQSGSSLHPLIVWETKWFKFPNFWHKRESDDERKSSKQEQRKSSS